MEIIRRPALWQPSFAQGYAAPGNGFEPANPGLWDDRVFDWHGPLGPTGLAAWDVSGFGNDGTLDGMTASDWVATEKGWSLDFDGADDFINVPDSDSLNPSKALTLAAWIYPTALATKVIIGKEAAANNRSYYVRTNNANTSLDFVLSADGTTFNTWQAQNAWTLNAWQHVAAVYRSDLTDAIIYNNGILQPGAWQAGANPASLFNNTAPVTIGKRRANDDQFAGRMATATIWGSALSPDNIMDLATDLHATVRPMQRIPSMAVGNPWNYYAQQVAISKGGVLCG